MSPLDHWDVAANQHFAAYMLANAKRLQELYGNRMVESVKVVRRQATSWAKELRELPDAPPDNGRTIWQYRMRQAEGEMVNLVPAIVEQPALL